MLKNLLFAFLGIVFLLILAIAGGFVWLVVFDPGEVANPKNIERILAIESPVYYSGGQSKVGVFFDETHRQYIPYDKIPKNFVNSIVAAEDQDFFRHSGIDPMGIARALFANVKAGRVVQGGSTITQQTAKNLFKRKDRSLLAKLKELIYALRLEYYYPKEKILEFYVNQFFVSGNGVGLGVAAEYFFDKPAAKLDLLECAFIAGSVKRPNYYNPFIRKSEAAAAEARANSKARANYVLGQMYKLGMIDSVQYQEALNRDIPFRKGQMSYSLNTIMDLVKSALAEPEVQDALAEHGIDNVATSGARIITTVEKSLQDSALSGLRRELSRLDTRLRGYERLPLQELYQKLPQHEYRDVAVGNFVIAKIVSVDQKTPSVAVRFRLDDDVHDVQENKDDLGIIDKKGLMDLLDPLVKYHRQRWSEAQAKDFHLLLDQLHPGDLVMASVREIDPLTGEARLDLEKYPELQGAVLALKDGTIRAMAGGFTNSYYNRAVHAKRTMGSAIKPLVYSAALQLGWNSVDALDNRRNVFVYQKKAYFPRPDHESPHDEVSMSWAGVHSENLATIWLLYHLSDKLTPLQFKEVAEYLDLAPKSGESYQQYSEKIRDKYGVLVDREALLRVAFQRAVDYVHPDMLFAGDMAGFKAVGELYYGAGFSGFVEDVEDEFNADVVGKSLRKAEEARLRQRLLRRNYLRYSELRQELLALAGFADSAALLSAQGRLYHDSSRDSYAYGGEIESPSWIPMSPGQVHDLFAQMDVNERTRFVDEIRIDGRIRSATLEDIQEALVREYESLASKRPYDFEVLSQVRDFRVLVSLQYMIRFCRALGIESALEPVLSFPLGSNVISLMELAAAYEVLGSGKRIESGSQEATPELAIIDRILDVDGDTIYSPERKASSVMDQKVTLAVSDILRNVVQNGTGRYADQNVRLHSRDAAVEAKLKPLNLKVPVLGKTGTANSSRNAVFVGIVPGLHKGGLAVANGYVLACYVGFDDNQPMERSTTHISGATGALPLWTGMANSILLESDYAGQMDLADLYFSGKAEAALTVPDLGQVIVPVEISHGGLPNRISDDARRVYFSGGPSVATFIERKADGDVEPARLFYPFWKSQEK
jgi:membrane peptidoglycan carboxypeptidase